MRIFGLSPLFITFVLTVRMFRSGRQSWTNAIVLILFGFFLATSMYAVFVTGFLSDVLSAFGVGH